MPLKRRVLVTGSRTWTDRLAVWGALDRQLAMCDQLTVVWGKARGGADLYTSIWCRLDHGGRVTPEDHEARWDLLGKGAGMVRNSEMVDLGADECLAFLMPCMLQGCRKDGGRKHWTHGTWDCAEKAATVGITMSYFYGDGNGPGRPDQPRGPVRPG